MRAKWSAPIRKYWKISEQMMVKYSVKFDRGIGFIAAPAIGESRYMAFGLQIDAEKRITTDILWDIAAETAGSGLAGT